MKNNTAINKLLEPAPSEQTLTLPGHIFFTESVEIPAELSPDELDDFAELSLEAISPFPLEHLYWGFLSTPEAQHILIYAAHRDRIKQLKLDNIDAYAWVLPDFAALTGCYFPEDTIIQIITAQTQSHAYFARGQQIPAAVVGQQVNCEQQDLVPAPKLSLETDTKNPRILKLEPISDTLNKDNVPVYQYNVAGERAESEDAKKLAQLIPDEATLWRADVRSLEFKKQARNNRRLSDIIAKAMTWAAIFAILLILSEAAFFGANTWLNSKQNLQAQQAPIAATVNEKQDSMNKLNQIAKNDLRPIEMLQALNNVRPNGIHFTSTVIDGANQIKIDGIAQSINELNAYTDKLLKNGLFKQLKDTKSVTRQGKTTFTVELGFDITAEPPHTPQPQIVEAGT